jgi:hypothetical protein
MDVDEGGCSTVKGTSVVVVLRGRVDNGRRNSGNVFGRWGANSGEAPLTVNIVWMRTIRRRASQRRAVHGASRVSTAGVWRGEESEEREGELEEGERGPAQLDLYRGRGRGEGTGEGEETAAMNSIDGHQRR